LSNAETVNNLQLVEVEAISGALSVITSHADGFEVLLFEWRRMKSASDGAYTVGFLAPTGGTSSEVATIDRACHILEVGVSGERSGVGFRDRCAFRLEMHATAINAVDEVMPPLGTLNLAIEMGALLRNFAVHWG